MEQADERVREADARPRRRPVRIAALGAIALLVAAGIAVERPWAPAPPAARFAFPPAQVTVSRPLRRTLGERAGFLGQFSAVDSVELRAQVGGILTAIGFADGQIVHKGDLLFSIDPRPYQIRLAQTAAQLKSAQARLALAGTELWRAQQLKRTDFGTGQSVDQRQADQLADQAALELAAAQVRDAELDLEFCQVRAPFDGRIGEHQVSVGSLVGGSRAGTSATTLLATLVSLDPIHLDFDMSEADFQAFQADRQASVQSVGQSVGQSSGQSSGQASPGAAPEVAIKLGDETGFAHHGRLDFIDNAIDRSSGTIHARATVANPDLRLIPGEFARLRLQTVAPHTVLMVPADAVVPDQSQHLLLTVDANNKVVPRIVQLGEQRGGLQVVTSGLGADDEVIIDGIIHARPGATVVPQPGTIRFDDRTDSQD